MKSPRYLAVLAIGAASFAGPSAHAALLTQAGEQQLETWLGQGNLEFTNIFTKTLGDGKDSFSFHAAADNKGPTFVLFSIDNGTQPDILVGGYDPLSWDSSGLYHTDFTDAGRSAFLFNLSTGVIQRQLLLSDGSGTGYYQTYNNIYYGPTFGGGHDLYTATSLESGYFYSYSYATQYTANIFGPGVNPGQSAGGDYYDDSIRINSMEVFTFAPQASTTPEPTSALFGLSLLGTVAMSRFRSRKAVTA